MMMRVRLKHALETLAPPRLHAPFMASALGCRVTIRPEHPPEIWSITHALIGLSVAVTVAGELCTPGQRCFLEG